MNPNITPDVFTTYTATQLARLGFVLGDEIRYGRLGHYILSEAQEDFIKGNVIKPKLRWSVTGATTTGSDANSATDPKIIVADAGATVAAGSLAGLRMSIMDVGATPDLDVSAIIKDNTAGVSGSPMTIYLMTALAAEVTTGISLYVWDLDYEELCETAAYQPCNGIAPCIVDMSEAPYFWRQVDGIAAVVMHDGATSVFGKGITPSSTAGAAILQAAGEGPSEGRCIGTVLQAATVAEGLALVLLNRLS